MLKKVLLLCLMAMGLGACGTTGTWVPNDPAATSQDRANRDMQQCIAYGDQALDSSGPFPILNMSIRNSRVEECMKRLGYHKADEIQGGQPPKQ